MSVGWLEFGVIILVGLVGVVVLFAAFLVWRDGYVKGWRRARAAPPTCPQCEYNLSGLTACRCPECGTEYRTDELWQAWLQVKPERKTRKTKRNRSPAAATRAEAS